MGPDVPLIQLSVKHQTLWLVVSDQIILLLFSLLGSQTSEYDLHKLIWGNSPSL
jgi:hypothetical protein